MDYQKFIHPPIIFLFLFSPALIYANDNQSIEFFASNNTKKISMEIAFSRLTGVEQLNLQNEMIKVLQKEHIDQGKFEDILGSYYSDNEVTADNTEHFSTSPYQNLSEEKIFNLAKEFAVILNQESVAVVIPDQTIIGDLSVDFVTPRPSINETTNMLHEKLPALYNQAYSLHLANKCNGINNTKVTGIEWLGSKINLNEVKKAFPLEHVNSRYGRAYLVYKDGQREKI